MPRTKTFEPDHVTQAAMDVFWRQGYEATSLTDLTAAMGLSKSSFYDSFGSKHELFGLCLSRYRREILGRMINLVQDENSKSPRTSIERAFYALAEEADMPEARRGCLLFNTASEFAQNDDDVARVVTEATDELAGAFRATLKRAREADEIRQGIDVDAHARFLVASLSGLKTQIKAGADSKAVAQIVGVVLSTLD